MVQRPFFICQTPRDFARNTDIHHFCRRAWTNLWLRRWTCNLEVPGSSPPLYQSDSSSVAPNRPFALPSHIVQNNTLLVGNLRAGTSKTKRFHVQNIACPGTSKAYFEPCDWAIQRPHSTPPRFVNSQLVCLLPVWILTTFCSIYNICFLIYSVCN